MHSRKTRDRNFFRPGAAPGPPFVIANCAEPAQTRKCSVLRAPCYTLRHPLRPLSSPFPIAPRVCTFSPFSLSFVRYHRPKFALPLPLPLCKQLKFRHTFFACALRPHKPRGTPHNSPWKPFARSPPRPRAHGGCALPRDPCKRPKFPALLRVRV